jgi:hypothetical protein
MPSIKLNEDEMTALFGLPHLSIVLYMLGLRPRMDFATGTVGKKPLISWQALREAVYVEPHPGIKHEYASMQAVRRAAVWLEKSGLVKMKSVERQLIFFLPLADADYSVRKKADRCPTDQADRRPTEPQPHKQRLSGASGDVSRQAETQKADSHPVSDIDINNSSTPLTTVDKGSDPKEAGEGEKFIFPRTITPQQKAAIALKVSGLGADMAQALIDELAGCIQAGTVKNLPGLTRHFVSQAEKGEFMPDKGVSIRAERDARAAEQRRRIEYEQRASEEAQRTVKGKGKPDNLLALVGSRKAVKQPEVET